MISAVICVFLRCVWHLYNLPFVSVLYWLISIARFVFKSPSICFQGENITFTVNVLLTRTLYSVTPGLAMIRAVYQYSRLILITVVILVLLRFPSETPKLNCNQTITVSWDEHLENLVSVQHLYILQKKTLFVQKS